MDKKSKIALILGVLSTGSIPVSAYGLGEIIGAGLNKFAELVSDFFDLILDKAVVGLLVWNPEVSMVRPLIDDFIEMLTPLYIIAFLIIGIQFFFLSESPKGRAKARSALLQLLLSIAFVISATTIYQFLLDLSELLVNFVMSLVEVDLTVIAVIATGLWGGAWLLITVGVLLILLFTYALRYLLLLIMAAIFPLVIFFFFFEFTKDYGRRIMKWTLMLIFVPVLQAIFLVFTITSMNNLGGLDDAETAGFGIAIAGFLLMIISPLMVLGILKWMGGVLGFFAFKSLAAGRTNLAVALFFAGGLMMGEGPGAVPLAATVWFIGKLEHGSEETEGRLYRARRGNIRTKGYGSGGAGGHKHGGGDGHGGPHRKPGGPTPGGEIHEGRNAFADRLELADSLMKEGYSLKARGRNTDAAERFTRARDAYRKVIELSESGGEKYALKNPRKAEIHAKLGDSYVELDKPLKAKMHYKRAVELDPKKPEYSMKLGDVLYKRG